MRSWSRAAVVAVLLSLVSGCAHSSLRRTLSCPHKSGPPWVEYASRHFNVVTDLPPEKARELVRNFEETYSSFVDITGWHFPGRDEPAGRMKLIVFERTSDYLEFGPWRTDGFFLPNTIDGAPVVVFTAAGTQSSRTIFLHELTHRLLRHYVAKAPLWLHEGLAEFYSTFFVDKGWARFGAVPRRMRYNGMLPPLRTLLSIDDLSGLAPSNISAFYRASWMLVYVMARYYERQLVESLMRMADGEEPEAAFAATFGANMAQDLNPHYRGEAELLYGGDYEHKLVSWKVPYTPKAEPGVADEAPLDDGEVHLLWASITPPGSKAYVAQLDLAGAHGSDSPRFHFMRGLHHLMKDRLSSAEYDLKRAVAARPDDERYRWALAQLHFQSGVEMHWTAQQFEALAGEMHGLEEEAHTLDSLVLLAKYFLARGQIVEARARAQRAVEIDPTRVRGWEALEMIAQQQGDIDGAISYAERTLHLAPDGADMSEMVKRLAKLRELRKRRAERATAKPAD